MQNDLGMFPMAALPHAQHTSSQLVRAWGVAVAEEDAALQVEEALARGLLKGAKARAHPSPRWS